MDGGFMADVFINTSALDLFSWTRFVYLSVRSIHVYMLRFRVCSASTGHTLASRRVALQN